MEDRIPCASHAMIVDHLERIATKLDRIDDKLDGVREKVASHDTSIGYFKAGFGLIITAVVTIFTYMFKS